MNEKSIAVVIPTYNEREAIIPLIEEILKLPLDIKVILVDDNSPDGTADIVMKSFGNIPSVRIYVRKGKRGRGLAGIYGFKEALKTEVNIIGEMDGDFSHHPSFIPSMIEKLSSYDVVVGSRYVKGGMDIQRGILRRIISNISRIYIKMLLGIKLSDPTSGYRFFRREILEKIIDKLSAEDPFIITEVLFYLKRYNARFCEVPITFYERKAGTSKLKPSILIMYLFKVLKLRTRYGRKKIY
ncbi:MAG TPA: polyprenol monophosphomannose synthase [bacterium]|nr:polyprenol monophosphomannose synthase [bacterium]HPP30737.1 polyprenol monophosphomannose synthase [bacterium]